MSIQKAAAEFIGTFALTFLVLVSILVSAPVSTPIVAALTVGVFVYLLGSVSGAHFNPAVTIGMLSINKIKPKDAVLYVICQFIGAAAALGLAKALFHSSTMLTVSSDTAVGISEGLGSAVFCFGVACVVLKKVPEVMSGVVIGVSLLLGITVASTMSNGVINPAVAFGIGSFGAPYVVGPIVGAIFGAFVACFVHGEKVRYKY